LLRLCPKTQQFVGIRVKQFTSQPYHHYHHHHYHYSATARTSSSALLACVSIVQNIYRKKKKKKQRRAHETALSMSLGRLLWAGLKGAGREFGGCLWYGADTQQLVVAQ